jgi:hypothetical protein
MLMIVFVGPEQAQRYRVRQRLVSAIGRVAVVAAVQTGQDVGRVAGVAENAVEVEEGVVFATCSDPGVDSLTFDFVCGREYRDGRSGQEKSFVRCERTAIDVKPFGMRTFNQFAGVPGLPDWQSHLPPGSR